MLYEVVITFESVDKILKCDYLNESRTVCLSVFAGIYFLSCL